MSTFINDTTVLFVSILLEALPFVLLGAFLSSLISVFISEERLMKLIPKNRFLAYGAVAFLGILFPVCDCTILPIMRRFIAKGMPIALAVTFMCAVPIVNPAVFASTGWAFANDPQVLWLRMGIGLGVAILSGMIISKLIGTLNPIRSAKQENRGAPNNDSETIEYWDRLTDPLFIQTNHRVLDDQTHKNYSCDCGFDHGSGKKNRLYAVLSHTSNEFFDSGSLILIGALLSALIQMAIPREVLYLVANGPVSSVGAMMGLTWLMSLCANADAFVAKSFTGLFTTGSIVAFMTFGQMIDLKNTAVLFGYFKKRFVLILIFVIALLNFIAGVAVNFAGGIR